VMGPYVGVAIFLFFLWILMAFCRMPTTADTDSSLNLGPTLKRLLKNRNYVLGVLAQFFYVGAQIGVWSFTIRYVMQERHMNEEQASTYYLAALILFVSARFICTGLMKYVSPGFLLTFLSFLAIGCCLGVIYVGGQVGVIALVGISGCMSLMFPTIYGLAVRGLGEDTKIGGSGLIMAILGGAVITALQGQVSDMAGSINLAYWVPLLCFVTIAVYGVLCLKNRHQTA